MTDRRLWTAIDKLLAWQHMRSAKQRASRCYEAVATCCRAAGLQMPHAALAIQAGHILVQDPARYGWVSLGTTAAALPTDGQPCLVFFDRCGYLKDGRMAGHVAIYKSNNNRHIANETREMNVWWRARVRYAFRPRTSPSD